MLNSIKKYVEIKTLIENISTRSRKRKYTYARALFYRIAKDTTVHSLDEIGSYVGKGHCEVLNAFKGTFPQAYHSEVYISEAYDDYVNNYKESKDLVLANDKTVKELILENLNLQEDIKELKSKKDIDNKGINSLLIKFNELTEDKQDTFILRADAILKMLNY